MIGYANILQRFRTMVRKIYEKDDCRVKGRCNPCKQFITLKLFSIPLLNYNIQHSQELAKCLKGVTEYIFAGNLSTDI